MVGYCDCWMCFICVGLRVVCVVLLCKVFIFDLFVCVTIGLLIVLFY